MPAEFLTRLSVPDAETVGRACEQPLEPPSNHRLGLSLGPAMGDPRGVLAYPSGEAIAC
jgi:hypothetical protein